MAAFSTLFLDLDDTLYPANNGVWAAVSGRIDQFLISRFGLSPEVAANLRAKYLRDYGTTLTGLMLDFNVDPAEYLRYVHDIPLEDLLQPDQELKAMLDSVPLQKVVFTNASREHATRVLSILGVEHNIDLVIDILATELANKPNLEAYHRALALSGNPDPRECVFVDDRVENLIPPAEMGMITVLVSGDGPHPQADYTIARITDLLQAIPFLNSIGTGSDA